MDFLFSLNELILFLKTHVILLFLLHVLVYFCSIYMFCSRKVIYSVICLIIVFIGSALILLIYKINFLGLLILIVYAGAILILFLFNIMMLEFKIDNKIISFKKFIFFYSFFYIFFFILLYFFNDSDSQDFNIDRIFLHNSDKDQLNNLIEYYYGKDRIEYWVDLYNKLLLEDRLYLEKMSEVEAFNIYLYFKFLEDVKNLFDNKELHETSFSKFVYRFSIEHRYFQLMNYPIRISNGSRGNSQVLIMFDDKNEFKLDFFNHCLIEFQYYFPRNFEFMFTDFLNKPLESVLRLDLNFNLLFGFYEDKLYYKYNISREREIFSFPNLFRNFNRNEKVLLFPIKSLGNLPSFAFGSENTRFILSLSVLYNNEFFKNNIIKRNLEIFDFYDNFNINSELYSNILGKKVSQLEFLLSLKKLFILDFYLNFFDKFFLNKEDLKVSLESDDNTLLCKEDIFIFGILLFTVFFSLIIILSLILLVAMIGPIILTFNISKNNKKQIIFEQILRKYSQSVKKFKNKK